MTNNKHYERIARSNYQRYLGSRKYNLWDCYEKFSTAKAIAFENCKVLMREHKGFGLKIISFNAHMFTAGFEFADKETGVVNFMYITKFRNTAVEV